VGSTIPEHDLTQCAARVAPYASGSRGHSQPPALESLLTVGTFKGFTMATARQRQAARKNIGRAQAAARKKQAGGRGACLSPVGRRRHNEAPAGW
jgi:hypothetical protein